MNKKNTEFAVYTQHQNGFRPKTILRHHQRTQFEPSKRNSILFAIIKYLLENLQSNCFLEKEYKVGLSCGFDAS